MMTITIRYRHHYHCPACRCHAIVTNLSTEHPTLILCPYGCERAMTYDRTEQVMLTESVEEV